MNRHIIENTCHFCRHVNIMKLILSKNRWKHLFRELDQDNSGEVTAQELYQIFKNSESNVTLQTIEQWIADYDQDGDGKLNYQEFMTYVGRQAEQSFP